MESASSRPRAPKFSSRPAPAWAPFTPIKPTRTPARPSSPILVTAAGTMAPARVLVIGAGVAGLQAIATARRLGAVVDGYDIRPAVKEEVESLGATFVGPKLSAEEAQDRSGYAKELSAEARARAQELLLARIPISDVVITTARVPGLPAPKLIPASAVAKMKPRSVIVDLAADMGGNCELTEPGTEVGGP